MEILSIVIGYLFGSIMFAHIVSKTKGVDITKVGTGNPGAANVLREVGKKQGIIVWFLDACKGAIAMLIVDKILNVPGFWIMMTGASAIIGHCFPLFYKFKGGKGLSTLGGIVFYIIPAIFPAGLALYFATRPIKPRKLEYLAGLCALAYFIYLIRCFYILDFYWLGPALLVLLVISIGVNLKHLIEEFKR